MNCTVRQNYRVKLQIDQHDPKWNFTPKTWRFGTLYKLYHPNYETKKESASYAQILLTAGGGTLAKPPSSGRGWDERDILGAKKKKKKQEKL